jgi:hypothetical protein
MKKKPATYVHRRKRERTMANRDKSGCWEVRVHFKEMDMSGGDNVDGPRWTGRFLDNEAAITVVATTKLLAESGALSLFHEHQHAVVKSAQKLRDVHVVVQL